MLHWLFNTHIIALLVVGMIYDCIVLGVIGCYTVGWVPLAMSNDDVTPHISAMCWCYLAAVCLKDAFYEVYQIHRKRVHLWEYFTSSRNYLDWSFVAVLSLLCAVLLRGDTDAETRSVLAICALLRWMKLLTSFRAFHRTGVHITKFTQSFHDFMTFLVLVIVFLGFGTLGHPLGSWYTANRDHALALATNNKGKPTKNFKHKCGKS